MKELEPIRGGTALPLEVWEEAVPGGAIVHVGGEVDLLSAGMLAKGLDKAVEPDRRLVVDLSNVAYIDGTGIRILEDLQRQRPGQVAILGSQPIVHRMFEILRLDSVIPVLNNRDEALRFLKR